MVWDLLPGSGHQAQKCVQICAKKVVSCAKKVVSCANACKSVFLFFWFFALAAFWASYPEKNGFWKPFSSVWDELCISAWNNGVVGKPSSGVSGKHANVRESNVLLNTKKALYTLYNMHIHVCITRSYIITWTWPEALLLELLARCMQQPRRLHEHIFNWGQALNLKSKDRPDLRRH